MPELPEVETIRRDLEKLIKGKKILGTVTDSSKQVKPSLAQVKKAILGAKIKTVKRRAKVLQIFLDNNKVLLVHLKLTGRLLVRKKTAPKDDWQHVTISLSNNKELRFCDLRKFGWIKLAGLKELKKLDQEFGPEPFTKDFTFEYFKEVLLNSRRAVKIVLMDQKKVAGIGNIYANEALFLAGIRPDKPAEKLRDEEIKKLREAIIGVLKKGVKYKGSTAKDDHYRQASGQRGSYQNHFLVYQRQGKKCFKCKGLIKRIKLGGRGTYFCHKCQK